MKKFLTSLAGLLFFLLFISHSAFAQIDWQKHCGTAQPSALSIMQPDTIVNGDSVIIIPTVFHILTQGKAENISKSHVQKALEILNRDFNRQNPDTFDIPAPFHPLRGNPKIEFRLAGVDPQGNCTDGIDRVYTPQAGIYGNLYDNYGWDHRKYINIYIVKWIENNPLIVGMAYLASVDTGYVQPDNFDFLQVTYKDLYDGLGNVITPQRSHVLSHEMGHNLGLNHVWGWLSGCTDDDDVADTPLQDDASAGYPVFPQISCNNSPDGDMFNNFMDYAEPINMFTEGQADRMRTCLARNEWRDSIWLPANLVATGVDPVLLPCQSPPVADFGYGNYAGWLCAGTPVKFYEAATINATSYQWEFTGGIPATSTDTFPSVIFPDSGMHSVTLIASNSFGVDTILKMIRIEPAEVTYNSSMTESFEDSVLSAQIAQWKILGNNWTVTNLAADSGSYSIRMDNSLQFFSSFFTHGFDLSQLPPTGRVLEFRVALGLSSGGTPVNGGLRVSWKRPCAYDFYEMMSTTAYGVDAAALHPGDALMPNALQTATTNTTFIPTSGQWKTITLSIPDSVTGDIQIGFIWGSFTPTTKFKGLYIDNIKVKTNTVGIAENNSVINWSLFPNPATDQLTIALGNENSKFDLVITDITGKIIYSETLNKSSGITINTSDFPKGVYLVRITSEDTTSTKKVIIQ